LVWRSRRVRRLERRRFDRTPIVVDVVIDVAVAVSHAGAESPQEPLPPPRHYLVAAGPAVSTALPLALATSSPGLASAPRPVSEHT
jgi:hypothetical protein